MLLLWVYILAIGFFNHVLISNPYWLDFDVWFCPGKMLGCIAGMWASSYNLRKLGTVVDRVCRGTWWRGRYANIGSMAGEFHRPLRMLFFEVFRIRSYDEMLIGHSFRGYRSLDLIVVHFTDLAPPGQGSLWVLSTHTDPRKRETVYGHEWYTCPILVSKGFADPWAAYYVPGREVIPTRAFAPRARL